VEGHQGETLLFRNFRWHYPLLRNKSRGYGGAMKPPVLKEINGTTPCSGIRAGGTAEL
jgi:hypothetical protein